MRLVLLGDPVEHSRSPAIHGAALAALGIDGEYRARRVDPTGLEEALGEIRAGRLDGANVTMPHKRRAAGLCDRLDPDAAAAGVVNTVVLRGADLVGWNTDLAAIRSIGAGFGDVTFMVLGAGGAAAAAVVALGGAVAAISARRPEAAEAMRSALRSEATVVPWGVPSAGSVVVNATPIGMHGEALPADVAASAAGLIDLAYGDGETPACRDARRRGIRCVDGLDFLVAQAADSFRLWTGQEPPIDVMTAAARS